MIESKGFSRWKEDQEMQSADDNNKQTNQKKEKKKKRGVSYINEYPRQGTK